MPEKIIHINNKEGHEVFQLSGNLIKITTRGSIHATPKNTGVVLSYTPDADNLGKGFNQLKLKPYLTNINGTAPFEDGSFWFGVDSCMSWTNDKSTIIFWDACPTCTSCDKQLELKSKYESLRLAVNDLKDVNLYDNATKALRNKYFESRRIQNVHGACTTEKALNLPYLDSYRLMLNYMTTVHMWNYVVSQNNTSTIIRTAAEDPSGFYIQSKRAVPSCNGTSTIKCTISISARDVQDGVSVLIARKRTEFKPFDGSGVSSSDITATEKGTTTKQFETTFSPVMVAGTFIVEVKLMPFMYVEIKAPNGSPINLNQVNWDVDSPPDSSLSGVDEETEFSTIKYSLGECAIAQKSLESPTVADYDRSKSFPARSLDGRNIWDIKLKWVLTGALGGTEGKSWEEDYVFAATKVRVPVNGLLRNSYWIDLNSTAAYEGAV